jgi:putative hemolysin
MFENSRFIIKTVENPFELEDVLRLRYEVFIEEMCNRRGFLGIDVDRYDLICDHLVVMDKGTEKVVGTYRLISSAFSHSFYSETEFNIDNIKKLRGNLLELGRACVNRDYRNGTTMALLWKGVSEYVKNVEAKYLFGCSSIATTDEEEIALLHSYFKEFFYSPEHLRVYPKRKVMVRNLKPFFKMDLLSSADTARCEKLLPPLLKSYLKAGSVVCGEPALDAKFRCTDFLTLLDIDLLDKTFGKKYKVRNGQENSEGN